MSLHGSAAAEPVGSRASIERYWNCKTPIRHLISSFVVRDLPALSWRAGAANTMAPSVVIGERASSMIKAFHGLLTTGRISQGHGELVTGRLVSRIETAIACGAMNDEPVPSRYAREKYGS